MAPIRGPLERATKKAAGPPVQSGMQACEKEGVPTVSESKTKTRIVRADCPDCAARIQVPTPVRIGQQLLCPNCDAELEVIDTDPVELDWVYDEYDEDEDEDEDE